MKTFRDLWAEALDRYTFDNWWANECRERFSDQDVPVKALDRCPDYYKNLRAENLRRHKAAQR